MKETTFKAVQSVKKKKSRSDIMGKIPTRTIKPQKLQIKIIIINNNKTRPLKTY
jgi:hypothetical protein